MTRHALVVLGSTGSIGTQTLDVACRNPAELSVVGISTFSHVERVTQQALRCKARFVVIADETLKGHPCAQELESAGVTVWFGQQALERLAALDDVNYVLNALVGAVGVRASVAALSAGKRLCLANKESLVVAGDLIMALADRSGELLPVDSEHGAIFQCLRGEKAGEASRIWLTASGGPFYGYSREQLKDVTVEQALSHPVWHMGKKITVDSATLMNKGLEVIEAHHLFKMPYHVIEVLIHPQGCIHSMVEFRDGSVKAQLGASDMRIPIQFALSYPRRWDAPTTPLDFRALSELTFGAPDEKTFRCLGLALAAGRQGGTAPAVLNAANEVAVQAFLDGAYGFCDIDAVIASVLDSADLVSDTSLEALKEADLKARICARSILRRLR